jgi:hypothetical protein
VGGFQLRVITSFQFLRSAAVISAVRKLNRIQKPASQSGVEVGFGKHDDAHPTKPDTAQGFRKIVRELENNPAASDLVLVRHAIWKFEIRIVGQRFC